MSIKTKIKNDMWRWNYIIPFVKKYQFEEKGKIDVIKHVISTYRKIKFSRESLQEFFYRLVVAEIW